MKYDDAENDDVEEEEDDTEDADAEEWSQDRAACFVQACAVCVEIYRKVPESRTKGASLRSRNALQHVTSATSYWN